MRTVRHFLAFIFCAALCSTVASAQDNQRNEQTNSAAAPEVTVIIQPQGVRFSVLKAVQEIRLQIADQHSTLLYDSGALPQAELDWELKDSNGQPLAPGLYAYTLLIKAPGAETPRQEQGHFIIEKGSNQFWLTTTGAGSVGANVAGGELTMARTPERTTAGAGYTASGRTLSERAGLQRDAQNRTVTEKKADVTREDGGAPLNISGSGTTGRLTKWLDGPGEVVGDSVIHETAAGDLGIGTTTPGGVLDVLRNSPNPLIGRFWNTGTGPAQLRFVGGTGATSQFLITDTAEWLTSIAVSNSIGMQFRVRGVGTPNNEAELSNSARLTILRNGAVGIGTTNPSSLFQIVMPGATARELHFGTPNGELGYSLLHSGSRADIRYDSSTLKLVNGPGGIPSSFNGIAINTAGRVGIGTTNPSTNLVVETGSFAPVDSGLKIRGSSSTFGDIGLRIENTGAGGREWYIDSTNNASGYGGGKLAFVNGPGSFPTLTLVDDNVGIGTTTPTAKLEVNTNFYSTAVQGISTVSSGFGAILDASNGSNPRGVWARSTIESACSGCRAGVFDGSVDVNGTLRKATNLFRIDHPQDPANKYLSHSVIEAPEYLNLYNGAVILDEAGEALVKLPSYFEALNQNFRYQLTAIGAPSPNLHVAQEVADNQFKIAGGSPGLKVSWQVTGVRQDAYVQANPLKVEEDKPEAERGSYLHPEVFKQPEEKGVAWKLHPEVMQQMKDEREKARRRAAGEPAEKEKP